MKSIRVLFLFAFACALGFSAWAQPGGDGAMNFYQKGEVLLKQGEPAKALEEYNSAITLNAEEPQFHFKKGICHLLLKDTTQAVSSFNQSTDLNPDFVPAYLQKAQIFSQNGETYEFVAAVDQLARLVEDPKKALEFKLNCAQALMGVQDWAKAYQFAKDAIGINAQHLGALLIHAKLANRTQDYRSAITSAENAMAIIPPNNGPKLAPYYYEKGYAHHFLGEYAKKEKAFAKAAPVPRFKALIDQLSPQYYFSLANAYLGVYNVERAMAMLDEAKKIRQDYSEAYILGGEIAKNKQFIEQETQEYRAALTAILAIDNPDQKSVLVLYEKLIETLLNAQQYAQTIKVCDEALGRFPSAHDLLFKKALATAASGKAEEGIGMLAQLLADESSMKPQDLARYYLALGLMQDKAGKTEEAKAAYRKSIEKMGNSPFAAAARYELEH